MNISLKRTVTGAALGVAVMFSATTANAAMLHVDFEGLAIGNQPGDTLTVTVMGVDITFAGSGLRIRDLPGAFQGTYGMRYLSTSGDSQPISVSWTSNFAATSASMTNPINGSITSEVDTIFGQAFDAGMGLVDSTTSSAETLTLAGAGMTSVSYDDVPNGVGYVLADFWLDGKQMSAVPVPAALPLIGSALSVLGLMGWRRRRSAA